jgi:hypothetical protein
MAEAGPSPAVEDGEPRVVDPSLDVEAVVARLRAGLLAGGAAGAELARLAEHDEAARRVAWHLHLAGEAIATQTLGGTLRGGPLALLRRPLHQLVRYYVETAMRRRATVDRHLAAALLLLAEQAAADRAEIARLRAEVEALRRG